MPLQVKAKTKPEDKHSADVNTLIYHNGKLYSGADDGKIIVNPSLAYIYYIIRLNPSSNRCGTRT